MEKPKNQAILLLSYIYEDIKKQKVKIQHQNNIRAL